MNLEVTTPSTITPWTLGDAKDHLRIRNNDDDGYIQLLTFAIVSIAEKVTRRSIFTQTIKLYLDSFECHEINLPRPPIQSVTSIKYYDTAGVLQTVDPDDYQVDAATTIGRVRPVTGMIWPFPDWGKMNAVVIEYVAGWTSRGQLPDGLRQAMLIHLSHLYDIREPVVVGRPVYQVPYTIEALYMPYRIMRFV
jgi:uncharacterized phiE125 gp8 family phage protein